MKTYYIPTSSLNFNNILSSESLSPKSFYAERKFGYPRWTQIPENPYTNSLVLYDQFCGFKRPISDMEDHPLLIEIELDDDVAATLKQLEEHIFLSDHTIYIDPFTTRLFFFSEKDKRITLSMSDASLETKFAHLYRNRILVVQQPKESFLMLDVSKEMQDLNLQEIEKDKRINRMKGLLYGYYIGALLSSSKDEVKRLNILREIHNILAAILASVDRKATPAQRKRLQDIYPTILPKPLLFIELDKIGLDQSQYDAVVDLVRKIYCHIPGEFDVDRLLTDLSVSQKYQDGRNPIVEKIVSLINQKENDILENAKPLQVEPCQIRVMDSQLDVINNDNLSGIDIEIFKAWVNEVLSKDDNSGKISTFKDRLSDDVTIKAKEICESEWKGSYPEITLNALRKHVRGAEYDHQWKDDLYSAISALIIRGDDWQKLLEYMQSKGMTDYRLAFAMYGTINGFANLTRDFTDILLNREDRKYVAEVYEEFYGQLLSRRIVKKEQVETSPKVASPKEPDTVCALSNNVLPIQEEIVDVLLTDNAISSSIEYSQVFSSDVSKSDTSNSNEVCLESKTNGATSSQSGNVQSSEKKKTPKQTKTTKQKKASQVVEQQLPFGNELPNVPTSSGLFLNDLDYLLSNEEFCNLMTSIRSRRTWFSDLKWFIDAHNPAHKDYNHYEGKPTDNETVIYQFIRLRDKRYEQMKDYLTKLYLNK